MTSPETNPVPNAAEPAPLVAAASPAQKLIAHFAAQHPGELATHLRGEHISEVQAVLQVLPPAVAVDVLRRLELNEIAQLLLSVDDSATRAWSSVMDPAQLAVVLAAVSDADRKLLLSQVPPSLAAEVAQILSFPPGTAGHLMDPRFATFRPEMTVSEALDKVRTLGKRRLSDLILTDDVGHFEGVVRLQDLVGEDASTVLGTIRNVDAPSILPMAVREDVTALLEVHRLTSLPVVDQQRQVLGTIRYDGLVAAARQNAIGNLQQMVGASAEEGALSSPRVGVRSRLPWLLINLLTAFLAASVVGLFENTIAKVTALAVMLPVVAGQSGNTGAQALAVTMRGLALREIRIRHLPKLLQKEAMVGAFNGVAVAVVTSAGVLAWSRSVGLAGVMFLSMIASMIAASLAGAFIPVLLVRLNRDPAVASSIILTTVTDICGFFSFLGLATLLMAYL